jgi:hypothetical protein
VLPLGGNAIRRSLGADSHKIISKALRDSIQHALDHREEALEYAMQFARDLDSPLASRFVSMYVNERTLDYGADGREAISKLLDLGHERGIIPIAPHVDFVEGGIPQHQSRLRAPPRKHLPHQPPLRSHPALRRTRKSLRSIFQPMARRYFVTRKILNGRKPPPTIPPPTR